MSILENKHINEIKQFIKNNLQDSKKTLSDISILDNDIMDKEDRLNNEYSLPIENLRNEGNIELDNAELNHDNIIRDAKADENRARLEYDRYKKLRKAQANSSMGNNLKSSFASDLSGLGINSFLPPEEKYYKDMLSIRKKAEKNKKQDLKNILNHYKEQIDSLTKELNNELSLLEEDYKLSFFNILDKNKIENINSIKTIINSIDSIDIYIDKYIKLFSILDTINIAIEYKIINTEDIIQYLDPKIHIDEIKEIDKNCLLSYEENKLHLEEIRELKNDINPDSISQINIINDTFNKYKSFTSLDLHIDFTDKDKLKNHKEDYSLLKELANDKDKILIPIKSSIDNYSNITKSKYSDILEISLNHHLSVINTYNKINSKNILESYNSFCNKNTNAELLDLVQNKFIAGGINNIEKYNTNKYFLNDLEEYPYLYSYKSIKEDINLFIDFIAKINKLDFNDFQKNINTLTRKIWIKRIAIVLLAIITIGYIYYQSGAEERARQEQIKLEKLEEQKKLKLEKLEKQKKLKLQEKNRKIKNINRVKSEIFIKPYYESAINNMKNDFLNIDKIDPSKESLYIKKYTNKLDNILDKLILKTNDLCKHEASKEIEAIDQCIKNNKTYLLSHLEKDKATLPAYISSSINDRLFLEKERKISILINNLIKDKSILQNKLNKSNTEADKYLINGEKIPSSLQDKINQLQYDIKNIEHSIKHYKKVNNTKTLDIPKPKDFNRKANTKKVVYKKQIVNKEKEKKKIIKELKYVKQYTQEEEYKKLQEEIDNIYINGGKPDKKLLEKLKKLKEQK